MNLVIVFKTFYSYLEQMFLIYLHKFAYVKIIFIFQITIYSLSMMGMEATLQRGFSLHEEEESSRVNLYKEIKVAYRHEKKASLRYKEAMKHLIPIRREKW